MNEPLDIQGVWWLPETPDRKVPGWLRYDAKEGGELRLSGSLRATEWDESRHGDEVTQRVVRESEPDKRIYPRIHGQSRHQLFHLEDSFQINIERYLCREEDAAETIHVNWLLTGAWFEGHEQVEFDRAVVQFQNLTDWINRTGLSINYGSGKPGAPYAEARSNALPAFRTSIDDDYNLSVWQQLSGTGDGRNEVILSQNWLLSISACTTEPLEFFTNRVSDFQDMLTIATGQVANIETFHFIHDEVPLRSMAGTPIGSAKEQLAYYSRWSNRDNNDRRLSPYAMLFTFDDLGGLDGVRRWMQFAGSYRSELSRVMATRYNEQMFLEDRVTNCVAALESFDRTRRNAPHGSAILLERLRECVAFAGAPFTNLLGGESIDEWTKRAKNHRNNLDHHLDAFRADTGIVERELGDQLFWLATLCFLRQAGAPETVFEKIGSNAAFRWVADRATARRITST